MNTPESRPSPDRNLPPATGDALQQAEEIMYQFRYELGVELEAQHIVDSATYRGDEALQTADAILDEAIGAYHYIPVSETEMSGLGTLAVLAIDEAHEWVEQVWSNIAGRNTRVVLPSPQTASYAAILREQLLLIVLSGNQHTGQHRAEQ